MNVVVLNPELVSFDIRPRDPVEARILDVNDAPATQADQVVMLVELGVEARRRTRVAGPGHQAQRHECPQDAVDCHARNVRQLGADRAMKLLSGRMVGAVLDRFKDGAPLGRDREAAFTMGREELVHSLLFFCRTHRSQMSICTR
jgi:hypothetical protein